MVLDSRALRPRFENNPSAHSHCFYLRGSTSHVVPFRWQLAGTRGGQTSDASVIGSNSSLQTGINWMLPAGPRPGARPGPTPQATLPPFLTPPPCQGRHQPPAERGKRNSRCLNACLRACVPSRRRTRDSCHVAGYISLIETPPTTPGPLCSDRSLSPWRRDS